MTMRPMRVRGTLREGTWGPMGIQRLRMSASLFLGVNFCIHQYACITIWRWFPHLEGKVPKRVPGARAEAYITDEGKAKAYRI
jgi:hypothetical protein